MIETDWAPTVPVISHFKYLGVEIYFSLVITGKNNFKHLCNCIKEDLAQWCDLTLSLSGRISLINMNILSRIIFYAGILPILIPEYGERRQNLVSDFIWQAERPKIRISILFLNTDLNYHQSQTNRKGFGITSQFAHEI